MRLGRIALEAVDDTGLGRSQGYPITRPELERDEEFLAATPCLGVEFVSPIELGLEGELPTRGL